MANVSRIRRGTAGTRHARCAAAQRKRRSLAVGEAASLSSDSSALPGARLRLRCEVPGSAGEGEGRVALAAPGRAAEPGACGIAAASPVGAAPAPPLRRASPPRRQRRDAAGAPSARRAPPAPGSGRVAPLAERAAAAAARAPRRQAAHRRARAAAERRCRLPAPLGGVGAAAPRCAGRGACRLAATAGAECGVQPDKTGWTADIAGRATGGGGIARRVRP